jgi:multiple sugar transport system permease protein
MMLSPKLKSKCQRFISKAVIYILLSCLGFVIIYPLFGRVMLSIMDEYDLYDDTVRFFTRRLNFGNYSLAIHYMNYWDSLFKTVIYVLTAGICQLFSSVVIGYGMARFKFFGNRLLFMFLLLSLIVPPHLISLPLYLRFQQLKLLDNIFSIAILCLTGVGLKSGLLIFIMQQYFRGFPKELEESAMIDGAGPIRTFFSIALPSAVPMIATVFLFSVVWNWTDNFYTSTFLPGNTFLPRMLLGIKGVLQFDQQTRYGVFNLVISSLAENAGVLLLIIPLIIIFIVAQRYFVESIENTGIVG